MLLRLLQAALLLCPVAVPAAELVSLDVQRERGVIHVSSEIHIAAPQTQVFSELTNYDDLKTISSRFKQSRMEVGADGHTYVYTEIEGCVWFFCRTVMRYALLETDPPHSITATVDPARSDFEIGEEHWELSSAAGVTVVHYTHRLDPSFWVPPVLGEWAIRKALRRDAIKAATRIEALVARNGDE